MKRQQRQRARTYSLLEGGVRAEPVQQSVHLAVELLPARRVAGANPYRLIRSRRRSGLSEQSMVRTAGLEPALQGKAILSRTNTDYHLVLVTLFSTASKSVQENV